MLYFITIWALLLIVSGIIGIGLLQALQADSFDRKGDCLIVAQWLGIVVLSVALLATSLVFPLSPLVGAIVATLLCTAVLAFRQNRVELLTMLQTLASRSVWINVLAVMVAVAALMTRPVTYSDTGLYHYTSIQWLATYGTVQGLALLFANFAFTSSWFALAAPLNSPLLESRVSAVTNGWVLLLVVVHALLSLKRILQGHSRSSDWLVLVLTLLALPLSRVDGIYILLVSPAQDMPVLAMVGVVAWCTLIICRGDSGRQSNPPPSMVDDRLIPVILAAGAVTFKLTAIPLLLVSLLFYSWKQGFQLLRLFMGGGLVAVILSPMFAASLITSGCPLFPSSLLCLDLPWTPLLENVKETSEETHSWVTWYGTAPEGVPHWMWALWRQMQDRRQQVIAFLALLMPLCVVYLRCWDERKGDGEKPWLLTLPFVGVGFFVLTSPFFRYMLPYLLLLPALSIAVYFHKKKPHAASNDSVHSTSGFNFIKLRKLRWNLVLLSSVTLMTTALHSQSPFHLVLPPPLFRPPVTQSQINGITYWVPEFRHVCWKTPIPCTYGGAAEDVVLQDPERGLRSGFKRKDFKGG